VLLIFARIFIALTLVRIAFLKLQDYAAGHVQYVQNLNPMNKKQGDNVIKNINTNNQFKMSDCRSILIDCNDSVFISTGFLFYYSFF
jgi:hypothetical protein